MRKRVPAASLAAALTLAASTAWAQRHGGGGGGLVTGSGAGASSDATRPGGYKTPPLILEKEQLGTVQVTALGRTRMRGGDCAGAIDAFDTVLRTAVDPTVNRDRGLCHEKLGHPYPAIDDYRVYLTARPEALDAEGIRQRLVQLEQSA